MATRNENLKKINDELEKLNDEELESVVGGTRRETALLFAAFQEYSLGKSYEIDTRNAAVNLVSKKGVEGALDIIFGGQMKYKIDVGLNGTGEGEQVNEYYINGQKLDNDQMLAIVHNMIHDKYVNSH